MRFLTQTYPRKAPLLVASSDLYVCAKHFGRLFIQHTPTGNLCYSPPDFIRVVNRNSMIELAAKSSKNGGIAVTDIIEFEKTSPRASGYSKRI